jgi:hypothetical protein
MTISLNGLPNADLDQRWEAWMARGRAQDAQMIFRMRLVFLFAAAAAVWAGAML